MCGAWRVFLRLVLYTAWGQSSTYEGTAAVGRWLSLVLTENTATLNPAYGVTFGRDVGGGQIFIGKIVEVAP